MTTRHHEQALLLLRKADEDLIVLKKWASDPEVSKAILGFHAQQAAEKLLKAVLAERQIKFPYTHYLSDLIALIKDAGVAYPSELDSVVSLSSFAVDFRYLEIEEMAESFDATSALKSLLVMRDWAVAFVRAR